MFYICLLSLILWFSAISLTYQNDFIFYFYPTENYSIQYYVICKLDKNFSHFFSQAMAKNAEWRAQGRTLMA